MIPRRRPLLFVPSAKRRGASWYTHRMTTTTFPATVRVPTGDKFAPHRVSADEYLVIDNVAERGSEFINGVIIAREATTENHVRITVNLLCESVRQIGERDYFPFFSQMRVRVGSDYHYPDAGIVCGETQCDAGSHTLTNPTVLVEVLSDTTEHVDRGVKLKHYLRLPSLRTYLLVAQDTPIVEQYERTDTGEWRFRLVEGVDATVELPAVACRLALADIYRRVTFPESIPEPVEPAA